MLRAGNVPTAQDAVHMAGRILSVLQDDGESPFRGNHVYREYPI